MENKELNEQEILVLKLKAEIYDNQQAFNKEYNAVVETNKKQLDTIARIARAIFGEVEYDITFESIVDSVELLVEESKSKDEPEGYVSQDPEDAEYFEIPDHQKRKGL